MTRREGLLSLLMITVRAMAGEASGMAQDNLVSAGNTLKMSDLNPPQSVFINLEYFKDWKIAYKGETLVITADELFTALKRAD